MGLKIFICLSFLTTMLNANCSTVLPETQETRAIASLLEVYQAYDEGGPIQLRRIGKDHDGGYVIPEPAIQKADIVIGYGVDNDISFEDSATAIYGKPSFGFDCTCPRIRPTQRECHFVPSCIVGKNSAPKFSKSGTFDEHLDWFRATDKKIFIKMDIEGNEYEAMPDILERAHQVTGIVLEIHFMEPGQISQALHLMQNLDREFLLVHVHANNYCKFCFTASNAAGNISRVLELSYINRALVERYEVSSNQMHPASLDQPNAPSLPDNTFTILGFP